MLHETKDEKEERTYISYYTHTGREREMRKAVIYEGKDRNIHH